MTKKNAGIEIYNIYPPDKAHKIGLKDFDISYPRFPIGSIWINKSKKEVYLKMEDMWKFLGYEKEHPAYPGEVKRRITKSHKKDIHFNPWERT